MNDSGSDNPYAASHLPPRSPSDRRQWPFMVQVGLWGLPNRAAAWAFFWLSLVLTAGCVAYGFVNPLGFIGLGFIGSAIWYYRAIKWVDEHGGWG